MDKKKYKILLKSLENAAAEDIDLFLQLDLNSTFAIMNKERYDNDFDLARQFERERDASRSFRLYGEIASTAIDCDNLTIRVFSDPNDINEIATIQTSKVSYNTNNVFGKKKGKYLLELDNYLFDEVYMLIESDNFSYQDQRWSQRLVFYDADNNFVSYGNETIDIDLDGNVITIENDFPFFFNKHWVRQDYDLIEEKVAEYTWNTPESSISEGQSVPLELRLNKPSPFGNERLTLRWSDNSSSDKFKQGILSGLASDNPQRIFEVNIPEDYEDQSFAQYNGNIYITIPTTDANSGLFTTGQNLRLLDGDYQGEYTILATANLGAIIPESELDLTAVFLDRQYLAISSNSNTTRYYAGSTPDVRVFQNGDEVEFPLELEWNLGETEKTFIIQGLNDFEIEFDEFFQIEGIDPVRVEPGPFPIHTLTLQNNTVPRQVRYNLQNIYENRLAFTGRTAYDTDAEAFDDSFLVDGLVAGNQHYVEGPAVLRNGLQWEGRNEEFYPNDFFDLTIINEGIKTVIPANPSLGILEPQLLQPQESLQVRVYSQYDQTSLNSYRLTWTATTITGDEFAEVQDIPNGIFINGCNVIPQGPTSTAGYVQRLLFPGFKANVDEGVDDIYVNNGLEKPFSVSFDEGDIENDVFPSATIVSLNPGVKLDVGSENPYLVIEEITPYFEGSQITKSILLNANSNENQEARYTIQIDKQGFKTLSVPAASIQASEGVVTDAYLVTGYENIFYPYDQELGQCFFPLNANNVPGVGAIEAIDDQPGYMERGNAYVNGALLLSAGLWPESETNITEPAITSPDTQETVFAGAFLPSPIDVIPCTEELISSSGTYGIWRIFIRDMTNLDEDFTGDLVGTRAFDINYGTGDGALTWTVGGERPGGPHVLENDATIWWNGSYVPVENDGNFFAPAILRQRIDEGGTAFNDTEIPEGPLEGTLVSESTLQLRGKTQGLEFSISNLQNFEGFNEGESTGILGPIFDFFEDVGEDLGILEEDEGSDINPYALRASRLAPALNPGDLNVGRNGLGGFALEIE